MPRLKRKVVRTFWRNSVLTGKPVKIAQFKIYGVPVNVRGVKFKMDYLEEADAKAMARGKDYDYGEPIEDSDYNLKRGFRIYREKVGFIQPVQMKRTRKMLKLSLMEVAYLLGMSFSTLSKLENGDVVQSVQQDTCIRCLLSADTLGALVRSRLLMLKIKPHKYVKPADLKRAVKISEKVQKEVYQKYGIR